MISFNTSKDTSRFNSYFEVVNRSVDRLEDAHLFLLPEQHTNKQHEVLNGWLISRLYRPGDLILVEGATPEMGVITGKEHQAKYVPGHPVVRGWDSMRAQQAMQEQAKEIWKLFHQLNEIHDSLLKSKIEFAQAKLKKLVPKMQLAPINKKSLLYLHMINATLLNALSECLVEIVNEHTPERNAMMHQTIGDFYNGKRRIFVIAGRAHFLNEKKAISTLGTFLQGKKFVIVDHKAKTRDFSSIRRELNVRKAGGYMRYILTKIKAVFRKIAQFFHEFYRISTSRTFRQRVFTHSTAPLQIYDYFRAFNTLLKKIEIAAKKNT